MPIDWNDPDVKADRIPEPPSPSYLPRSLEATLLAASRAKRSAAVVVLQNPEQWKVCGVCERLVKLERTQCPFCHSYHFSTGEAEVIAACCRDTGREPNLPLPRF